MSKTRYVTVLALLAAMASILHVVEGWLPLLLPVPGAKLGLANIVSLFALVILDLKSALYVTVTRVVIGSLFGASFLGPAFLMSMGGAVLSTLAMNCVYRFFRPPFSLCGVSTVGASVHNVTQVILAAFLISSASILWYLPYLLFFAVPVGVFTGAAVGYLAGRLPPNVINTNHK